MNTKILIFTTILMFLSGSFFSCSLTQEEDESMVPFSVCPHEGNYIDTVKVSGNAYLFNDFVPEAMKAKLQQERNTSGFVAWIVYLKSENSATMFTLSPIEECTNIICNYPYFAKQWEVPLNGLRVTYDGTTFMTGAYLSAPMHVGNDMVLTKLKRMQQ